MRVCAIAIVLGFTLSACSMAPTHVYTCTPSSPITVKYDNTAGADAQAVVTLDGRTYTLTQVRSASGARYLTEQGRSPGATLVWWNKGQGGTLFEGKVSDPAAQETAIATCTQAR
jgi:membrane-bound inhibitor of C-type lysozyme